MEFPRAKPKGTPQGKELYLSVYPKSSPNTDNISFLTIITLMFTSLFSLTISLYTPYCVIYPSLQGNIEEFDFSIPLLRMI